MDHDFYVGRLRDRYALRVLLPGPVDRATVDRVIFEELVKGSSTTARERSTPG